MDKEDIIKNLLLERDEVLKLKNDAKLNKNKELYDVYKKKYFALSNRIDYYSNKDKKEFIEMKYKNNNKYIYNPVNYEKIKTYNREKHHINKKNIECC